MSRPRSTTFQGASVYRVDPDAYTFRQVIEDATKDINLVRDILSGDNSPPSDSTITHEGKDAGSGYFRGCPLGVPVCNWIASVTHGAVTMHKTGAGDGYIYAAMLPFYLPLDETTIRVQFASGLATDPSAFVLDAVYTSSVADVLLEQIPSLPPGVRRGYVEGLTGGTKYVLAIAQKLLQSEGGQYSPIYGLSIGFGRVGNVGGLAAADGVSSPTSVPTKTASSATVADYEEFDSVVFDDGFALSSMHAGRLARNIHALTEELTGAPGGINAALSLADSGATDPTGSAFHDHSRASNKTNEPLVDFPLWAEAFGAINQNGLDADMVDWQPPAYLGPAAPTPGGSTETFAEPVVYVPDSPEGGDSVLECMMIGCSPGADAISIDADVSSYTTAGSLIGSAATATFAQMASTQFYIATLDTIPFHADEQNLFKLSFTPTAITKVDGFGFAILGACLYLKPA